MTNMEKMKNGKLYNPNDSAIVERRVYVHSRIQDYNAEKNPQKRELILTELFGRLEEGVYLEAPVHIDYGHISFGKNCFTNFNFTALDCAPIEIGENVLIGPNVTMATAMHPMLPEERVTQLHEDQEIYGIEYALPIKIENHVWIASNVTILPGITIGEGSVIGAGSVVNCNIPPGVLAAGNPCRIIRKLGIQDSLRSKVK